MQRSRFTSQATPTSQRSDRDGFTLIELIVVILILAILAAILLPAIGNIRTTARNAQVTVEIQNLEKAIADFKLKYGMDPPSSFLIGNDDDHYTGSQLGKNSIAIMRQLWPTYSPSESNSNLPGQLLVTNGVTGLSFPIYLNGSECLSFFLGGAGMVTSPGTTSPGSMANSAPLGFSANPSNPFATGGNRVGPFYEFDAGRLLDLDSDGVPEALDPLPNQTQPYQYLSSYNGRGYQHKGYNGTYDNTANSDDEVVPSSLTSHYFRSATSAGVTVPWNAKSFQIISPGFDGSYGTGGGFRDKTFFDGTNTARTATDEKDNSTNFSKGPLVP